MLNLQGSTPNLQGSTPPPSTPVGVQAKSPTNNITPPPNTVPANQQNLKDVSQYYANVNGTIYNKARGASGGLDTWDHFLQDAGLPTGTSGTTLKFDTIWTPPSNSTPSATSTPNSSTTPNPAAGNPAGAPSTSTGASSTGSSLYGTTIPNNGTTGVSLGGTIADLIKSVEDPNNPINSEISKYTGQLKDLNTSEAQSEANIDSEPIDLSLASGQKGILQRLFAAKQGALQTGLNTAVTNRGQVIQGLTNAGQLNPQITNPLTGGLQSASVPTGGQTTSGAQDISSLIGQGNGTNGHPQGEFFNSQTGQGFSSSQQLADFVNKQIPNSNATPENVFQLLSSGVLSNSTGSLSPQTMNTYVQMLLNGQTDQIPGQIFNNPTLKAQLQQAAQASNPNFNVNEAMANAQQIGNLSTQKSQLNSVFGGAKANLQLAINIAKQGGVNDTSVPLINVLNQAVSRGLLSQQDVISFQSILSSVQSQYAQVLGGGTATVDSQNQARQLIPDDISLGALQNLGTNLNSDATNRINAIQTQIDALKNQGHSGSGSGGSNPLGLPGF